MNDKNDSGSGAAQSGWVPYGNGYEMTQSRQIISKRLMELKQRRTPLVVVHENYQSGFTMLLGFAEDRLLIDKPLDWPGTQEKVRIIYRDSNNLWAHFFGSVVSTNHDILYVKRPTRFFLLQRREYYRVEMPVDSLASFIHKKTSHRNIIIKDMSAGGMLLACKEGTPLTTGAVLENIFITLPSENKESPVILLCKRGDIVRTTVDKEKHLCLLGVQFKTTKQEEEAITRYIRQRELELLRKISSDPRPG